MADKLYLQIVQSIVLIIHFTLISEYQVDELLLAGRARPILAKIAAIHTYHPGQFSLQFCRKTTLSWT